MRPITILLLLQTILTGARQVPISQPARLPILDDQFESWLHETGHKWGMKGVAIALIRRGRDETGSEGWQTEMKGYGVADRWGRSVDEKGCPHIQYVVF